MRIAVDTRELHGRPTGVGRYLSEILGAWETLPEAREHTIVHLAPESGSGGTLWEQITLPRLVADARADVLFSPAYTAPLRCSVPVVLTIHDVSYAAHPEWFPWLQGARRRTITRLAARHAARILTESEWSRREIVRYCEVEPSRVRVIYAGVSGIARPQPASPLPSDEATVLYVGSVFNRRHVPELIAGFSRLAPVYPKARLEIVGDNRSQPHIDLDAIVAASGLTAQIGLRTYVPDSELAALYASARAFVFLSSYEGFGFTPLEALASGLPIVVLDTPVAREIYGEAAIYVAQPDPAAIAHALELALFDDRARQRVLDAAPAVLGRYSWRRCAAAVLDELVRAARL